MPLKLKSVTEDDGKLSTHNGLRNILEWNLRNTDLSLEGDQAHHIRRVSAVESCNCKGSDTRWCNRQLEQLSNMLLSTASTLNARNNHQSLKKRCHHFAYIGFVMIMLRFGGLLIGRQAGGAAGWDQGQVTEHRTANGNPLFLFASFATSTLCVCMCKTCPSYLSMLNCASNKTNSWKGLVSYCYFGKKMHRKFLKYAFCGRLYFFLFSTMDLILQQPMLMSITVGQRADPDCPVELV